MNRLTAIQRECLDIVRDEYGVSDARVVPGGKHPQLKFTYAGVTYSKTLPHGNTPDFGRSANNYAAWLRRDLGEPPVKPVRVKRNLEDMMPTINDLIEPREQAGWRRFLLAVLSRLEGTTPQPSVAKCSLGRSRCGERRPTATGPGCG